MIEQEQLTRIIEGALLASDKPMSVQQLGDLFEEEERPSNEQLREALDTIERQCEGRGFELKQVASGYRFQVVQDVAPWVGRLWEEKPQRYSRAMLETLALIAYRQPITRGDIEEIRGVAVSSHIIKTLTEREWVRVVGHKDVPGRPAMYATTRKFLDYFNLRNLDELPTLADIKDLDSLNGELRFSDVEGEANGEQALDATESTEQPDNNGEPAAGGDEEAGHEAEEPSAAAELPSGASEDEHAGADEEGEERSPSDSVSSHHY